MAKDWEKLDYFQRRGKISQMAEAMGLDVSRYRSEGETTRPPGMPGGRGYEKEDLEQAVVNAMQNDYDTRRSIEAGKLSGNKRFQDFDDGISNISEAYAANTALKKTHKKDMGNGGKFSSANDYGGVTNYLVNAQAKSSKNEIMQGVQNQIDQAISRKKDDDDSDTNSYGPSYNEFYGLEGEVRKASSGFGATNTPASEAQNMLFNVVNDISKDKETMEDAKFNQDKYALGIGNLMF